jgi:hypothetical protein
LGAEPGLATANRLQTEAYNSGWQAVRSCRGAPISQDRRKVSSIGDVFLTKASKAQRSPISLANSRRGTATSEPLVAHVDLDLEADVPVLSNPEVDIDFDLRFLMVCRPDGQGIDFQFGTENFVVDADAGLVTEFLGYLFCAYDPDCEPGLLSYIESQVRGGFAPLAETISIQSTEAVGACALGFVPTVAVTDGADVVISIEPGSGNPAPPTPTPMPYGNPRDGFVKRPTKGLLLP